MRKRGRKEVRGGTARKNKAKNGAKWESGVVIAVEKKGDVA